MSLDLKRQLVAQLVESSRLLRNYIDHRAKSRGSTRAQWIVLFRLRDQEGLRIKGFGEPGDIAAK
jgi:MarR family transcriptional regulator, transcriptional regulator for hemolysin